MFCVSFSGARTKPNADDKQDRADKDHSAQLKLKSELVEAKAHVRELEAKVAALEAQLISAKVCMSQCSTA